MPAVVALVVGLLHLVTRVWGLADPRGLHDALADFGPFSDHALRDVASAYLAFGVGLLVVARLPVWRRPVLALAALWNAVHLVLHLVDLHEATPGWVGPFDASVLFLTVVALVAATCVDGSPAVSEKTTAVERS